MTLIKIFELRIGTQYINGLRAISFKEHSSLISILHLITQLWYLNLTEIYTIQCASFSRQYKKEPLMLINI